MKMKPRTTVHNERAVLFRRYSDIDESVVQKFYYKTVVDDTTRYWKFDVLKVNFVEITADDLVFLTAVNVTNTTQYFHFKGYYYHFSPSVGWVRTETVNSQTLADEIKVPSIAKYQTNRYYFVGYFDYMIRGGVESADVQPIKGLITPSESMTIRTFSDDIKLDHDDLVVIGKRLYSIESMETVRKMQPKPFCIYTATLNSIL